MILKNQNFSRVVLLVLDSVGCGNAVDAADFGDEGSNTLGHIGEWCKDNGKDFTLPNLSELGLGKIVPTFGIEDKGYQIGASFALRENSPGKDTTTGHWEIAGTPLVNTFDAYPEGFDKTLMQKWAQECQLEGWLHNNTASGTAVIEEYGEEHMRSGKPIVYTSADSVWQIAAHEESFGLERLYEICRVARKYADELNIGRVIARPFVGQNKNNYERTENRRDFSDQPPKPNMLDLLIEEADFVGGVGKIKDIFAGRSVSVSNHTGRNETSQEGTLEMIRMTRGQRGLIFTNLIDFDMHYGHRRDPAGYADCLMRFDNFLPNIYRELSDDDLLIITADHGNDPTHTGTDHTRENIPVLVFSKSSSLATKHLDTMQGFHHIARLSLEAMGVENIVEKIPSLSSTESFLG